MRTRSHSAVRLDQIMITVQKTVLKFQDPVTGLFENNPNDFPSHAWIRDNIYAAQAIWAMYRAFGKCAELDEDLAKARELGLNCVKTMQSLLECMIRQAGKIERFKYSHHKHDSLHAKYSARTKSTVVGDYDWGHLQVDAISLYLLILAQMTASGLQIIRTYDEVAFIQNLVYYIEYSYRTPDFGIWERGDKTNQGIRELNASSIGMAKAAMQALNDVGDLFGDGSKSSLIHVLPDEIQQCSAALSGLLPSESFSKETDAALLSIISYPAFAIEDNELAELTYRTILEQLAGRYGCRRFLRDGYKTAPEDPNRLHYFNSELQKFEDIECEWPVFVCYLLLDAMFRNDNENVQRFWRQLQEVLVPDTTNSFSFIQLVPELYKVPSDKVELERVNHGSQDRIPGGSIPYLWAQSLYIMCSLLHDGFLSPAELDPLSRRLSLTEKKPTCDIQIVLLAENKEVQKSLHDDAEIDVQLRDDIDSTIFSIQPASSLAKILTKVGKCEKLELTGRPPEREVQLLSTSKLFHIGDKFVAFTPQFMDSQRSHLWYDTQILVNEWSSELQYLANSWNSVNISGKPLVVIIVSSNMLLLGTRHKYTILGAIKKIKNGYIGGARVSLKNMADFLRTTSVSKLELLRDTMCEDLSLSGAGGIPIRTLPKPETPADKSLTLKRNDSMKDRWKQFDAVHKTSLKHRSIVLDSTDADLLRLRLKQPSIRIQRSTSYMVESDSETSIYTNNDDEKKADALFLNNHLISNSESSTKLSHSQLEGLSEDDLLDMLTDATTLDEQASIIHYLWLKFGPEFSGPNFEMTFGVSGVNVRALMEEIYIKACECRDWSWVRITGGLLSKQLDELDAAVTHLLVRQKQLTVGMPSKNEVAITSPKTKDELHSIFSRCYGDDNSFIIAQELIVSLGSLVRTDPKLFVEMFRLRIGLIIQVLASELSRLKNLSADQATQHLLSISPFEVKSMLFSLLSGRLLEELVSDTVGAKESRTGMGSFRQKIEERKSMRKSKSLRTSLSRASKATLTVSPSQQKFSDSDSEDSQNDASEFQFGIWLRHRTIDGALNRVPPDFYPTLWNTVRMFPYGLSIDGIVLKRSLTQEMTRREIKFALEVEQVLNQIPEPEYRELIVEALTLLSRLKQLILAEPKIPSNRPFDVEHIVHRANTLFIEHNVEMETIVLKCCGSGNKICDGSKGICKHFYDTAPAGEFGTAHYLIRALIEIFDNPSY